MRAFLLVLFLVPPASLAADFAEVDGSLRSELQGRRFTGQVGAAGAGTLQLLPQAGAVLQLSPGTLTLSYGPQVLLQTQDSGPDVGTQVLHRGRLMGEYRFTPDRRLVLTEQASYGKLDFFSAAAATATTLPTATPGTAPPPLQPIPRLLSLPFGESATDVVLDGSLDRLTRLSLDLSYLYSGGVGAGQLVLPLQRRAQGTATLSAQSTRTDTFSSAAFASRATFSEGQLDFLAGLTETWRHKVTATSDFQLGLGADFVRSETSPSAAPANLWMPGAIASYHEQFRWFSGLWSLDALGNLGPFVDRLTGHAYERGEGSLSLSWNDAPERWVFTGRTRGAVAVFGGTQHGESILQEEVSAAYLFSKAFKAELGTRLLRQREPLLGNQAYWESVTYVSITLTERSIL